MEKKYELFVSYVFKDNRGIGYGNGSFGMTRKSVKIEDIRRIEKILSEEKNLECVTVLHYKLME